MDEIFKKIGSWAFLLGIVIAVVVGVIFGAGLWNDPNNYVTLLLALLGFIVGVLTFFAMGNIAPEKVPTFLIAALLLVGIGAALQQDFFVNLIILSPDAFSSPNNIFIISQVCPFFLV